LLQRQLNNGVDESGHDSVRFEVPIEMKVCGSGITEREFRMLRLDFGDQSENDRLMRQFLREAGKPLETMLAEIEVQARRILSVANLPTERALYGWSADGQWGLAPNGSLRGSQLVADVADAMGLAFDSPAGNAARIVDTVSSIRSAKSQGSMDQLGRLCFCLGVLVAERDLKAGPADGPSRGGIKGSKVRWDRAKRIGRDELQQAYQKSLESGASKMKAYRQVARKYGVGVRTVQRAVAS
jgi:hypothetical protein